MVQVKIPTIDVTRPELSLATMRFTKQPRRERKILLPKVIEPSVKNTWK
jgi:hypothetical protein